MGRKNFSMDSDEYHKMSNATVFQVSLTGLLYRPVLEASICLAALGASIVGLFPLGNSAAQPGSATRIEAPGPGDGGEPGDG